MPDIQKLVDSLPAIMREWTLSLGPLETIKTFSWENEILPAIPDESWKLWATYRVGKHRKLTIHTPTGIHTQVFVKGDTGEYSVAPPDAIYYFGCDHPLQG